MILLHRFDDEQPVLIKPDYINGIESGIKELKDRTYVYTGSGTLVVKESFDYIAKALVK